MGVGSASCASMYLVDILCKSSFRGGCHSEPIVPDDILSSGLLGNCGDVERSPHIELILQSFFVRTMILRSSKLHVDDN